MFYKNLNNINILFFRYLMFYFLLNLNFFAKFVNGFLFKKSSFFIFFDVFFLNFFVVFLKNNLIFKISMLLDISVVDYSLTSSKSFELTYCFLNISSSLRYFFKTFSFFLLPIFSLSFYFSSANWLEREI